MSFNSFNGGEMYSSNFIAIPKCRNCNRFLFSNTCEKGINVFSMAVNSDGSQSFQHFRNKVVLFVKRLKQLSYVVDLFGVCINNHVPTSLMEC